MRERSLVACDPSPNAQPEDTTEQKAEPNAPRRSALEEARTSVTAHMGDHLSRATQIRDAVVLGKLNDAKVPAKYLAEHWPEQVLETWVPFVVALRSAAGDVEQAKDLGAASQATARLALACGQCHQGLADGPTFEVPPSPAEGDDQLMQRHRWAADRLWEGVVQPSADRWTQGVEGLQELPACQEDPGGEQLLEAIEAARETTEAIRTKATEATSLDARAQLYGELLTTCNGCHLAGC